MATNRTLTAGIGLLVLVALGPGVSPVLAEPHELRWKFQTGETLRYEFRQSNVIQIKAGDQQTTNTTALVIDLTWKVKAVAENGTAEITQLVDRVRAEVEAGPQKVKYDSKDTEEAQEPVAKALQSIYSPAIGQKYTLKIDPRGQLVEVKVPEKVTEALKGSPFLALANGGSVLSEMGLKNLLAQVLTVLPEKPVSQGDTWPSTLELPVSPVRLSLAFQHKLVSYEPGTARIDSKIDTTIKPEPDTPFTIEVKKQSGSATYSLDTKAGRWNSSEVNQELEMSLGVKDRRIEQLIKLNLQIKLVP